MKSKRFTLLTLATLLALAAPALAQPSAQELVAEYARQHGLPTRQVRCGPESRQVCRTFVPVLPTTYASFLERFNGTRGFCHLNFNNTNNHMALGVRPPVDGQPSDCYLWARNYNGAVNGIGDYRYMYMSHNPGGYIIPVNLQGARLQHLNQWLQARTNPQDTVYRQGNCMEWLPNAEVGPSRPLFHELGLHRSRDGRNMKAKVLHAANANVGVVGVFVNDVNAFNQMNDQQLLGPPPAGGITDAARGLAGAQAGQP